MPSADGSFRRFMATEVLDLLPDAANVLREAHRLLVSDGKLCVVTSRERTGPISHLVSAAWMRLYKINPRLVRGCRSLQRRSWLDETQLVLRACGGCHLVGHSLENRGHPASVRGAELSLPSSADAA